MTKFYDKNAEFDPSEYIFGDFQKYGTFWKCYTDPPLNGVLLLIIIFVISVELVFCYRLALLLVFGNIEVWWYLLHLNTGSEVQVPKGLLHRRHHIIKICPGVLVFYLGCGVRVECVVWGEVLEIVGAG